MSYVRGKARGASHIIAALNHLCFDGWSYVKPFCGMAHVLRRVHKKKLDPPYAGTLGYHGTTFDRAVFWDAARAWSHTAVVLVSEYSAPRDWQCIAERCKASTLAGAHRASARVERLFAHESWLRRLPPELRGL